jgi:hypothetical protein
MVLIAEEIARELEIPDDELFQRSLKAFLEREMRATQLDIGDLRDRYGVPTADELRAHIERGEVYSHPAWEEAIEWERLEGYISRLQRLLAGGVGV